MPQVYEFNHSGINQIFLAAEAYNFGSDTSKFDGISIRELTLILAYTSIDLSRTKLNETHKYV
jgi:hypothetical protein